MAESPDGMTILMVEPRNYDQIIELSQSSPNPYTVEDLERLRASGRTKNRVVMVMFMSPDYWTNGLKEKK